jgi:hypothetical protein
VFSAKVGTGFAIRIRNLKMLYPFT